MAVKTTVKETKSGIDVQIRSPGYIVSPDRKFLEIRKFDLDLQVQVPTSDSAAPMKCELACKAEATACQKKITAELALLLKTVQECKKKEAGGDDKAGNEADKERKKAVDKIQDYLADARVAMRKSIAAGLRMKSKEIMTVGRGSFGDKAIQFPKGLFENISLDKKATTSLVKSVDALSDLADEAASMMKKESVLRQTLLIDLRNRTPEQLTKMAGRLRKGYEDYQSVVEEMVAAGEGVSELDAEIKKLCKTLGKAYEDKVKKPMDTLRKEGRSLAAASAPRVDTVSRLKGLHNKFDFDDKDWEKSIVELGRYKQITSDFGKACKNLEKVAKEAQKAAKK